MNRKFLFIPVVCMLLSACAPGAGGPGPRTWIDAPLDGSSLSALGPVVVRSHAASSSAGGTLQAALLVNGTQVRMDQVADADSALVEFSQAWVPEGPGMYILQVVSSDQAGNQGRSNIVRVQVGAAPDETASPAATAVTPAPETLTPTQTQIVGASPTPTAIGAPTITFGQNTNCREGDSTAYEVVTSFREGEQIGIEGRNADGSWFRVLVPTGGHCWVSAATGTPAGPYGALPVIAPPPRPTDTPAPAQPPPAPGNLHIAGEVCNANEYKVTLEWGNVSGEDGYKVYRDGQLVATLGRDAGSYTDAPPDHNAHTYGVEAFNGAGASTRPTAQEDGCLF